MVSEDDLMVSARAYGISAPDQIHTSQNVLAWKIHITHGTSFRIIMNGSGNTVKQFGSGCICGGGNGWNWLFDAKIIIMLLVAYVVDAKLEFPPVMLDLVACLCMWKCEPTSQKLFRSDGQQKV